MRNFLFLTSFLIGTLASANTSTAPLLEFIYSPGRPVGNGTKSIAKQCLVHSRQAQMITADLLTGERSKSEKPVSLDVQAVSQLISKAAQGAPKLEIGPTDVASTYYFAWIDENPNHRYVLKATGSHSGENSTAEARKLISLIEEFCQFRR